MIMTQTAMLSTLLHRGHISGGGGRLGRAVVGSLASWTASLTLVLSSLLLTQYSRPSGGGVAALSCMSCDPTLCPSTTDCPGGLVMDICNCCHVCARIQNQKCGGMFGILGTCDKNLQCFIRSFDGHPITGHEEGICKEIQELPCTDSNCPLIHEPDLCPPDSYLATSAGDRFEDATSSNIHHSDNHSNDIHHHNEASSESYNLFLLPEKTSFCMCNTSACETPVCQAGYSLQIAHPATGVPGSCCNIYVCNRSEACQSVMCPPYDEEPCPADSERLPSKWTEDHCCELQQGCTCLPEDQCKPVWCQEGFQVQITSRASRQPGSCCDKFRCVNESGLACTYNGREIENGETWQIDKCKVCECRDGLNRCKDKICHNLSCTWMVIPEGECCPVCRGCVSDSGDLYNESAVWKENDCTTCTCKNGHAQCQAEMCAVQCANPKNVPGQCCPMCPDEELTPVVSLCVNIDGCHLSCKHGLEKTSEGCFLCRCKEETCHLDCQFGLKSDVEGNALCECKGAEDRCPPWEEDHCEKKCEYGYKRSRDGCIKCKCRKCPQFNCTKRCIHGHILNDEGCALCKCKEMAVPELINSKVETEHRDGKACMSWEGSRHEIGESWNDGCRSCYCHKGMEMCSLIACPIPHCANPVFRIGDCCPTCPGLTVPASAGDKELCESYQGHYYVEGESWKMDSCTHCVCHGGTILCEVPSCPPVLCHHPVKPEGQCCASCREDDPGLVAAYSHGHHCILPTGSLYKHGEVWQSTPCQSCVCQDGHMHCFNQMCPPLNCNRSVQKKGHCCSTCVDESVPKICNYGDVKYESGEKWEGDNCSQCFCYDGQTQCFPLSCPNLDCKIFIKRRGHCCLECYDISNTHSQNHGGIHQHWKNGTALPADSSSVDGNIIGFAVLGVLLIILAVAVFFLVLYLMNQKHRSQYRLRQKSSNLEHPGQIPFIPQQHTKVNSPEKQYLEKLCPGITTSGKGNRASNDYTEMVFRDLAKDNLKDSNLYSTCVNS